LGLKNHQRPQPTRFCVSGCPQKFSLVSKQWLGFTPKVEQISLPIISREIHSSKFNIVGKELGETS
jgi:hypothetical protein